MKKTFIYSLVILLLFSGGCSGKRNRDNIKVMTLNVRYDNPGDSINAWPNRASIVCNFISQEEPDLLGMQEVLLHQYNLLDSVLTEYHSVGVGRNDGAKRLMCRVHRPGEQTCLA